MSLPDGFIDEIKARVRPSDLIGRSVALKRQGREWVGLSPFKKERTPSFFVNDEKGFYHCFASQKHGDVITWLQETQGLSFIEAVEQLASEAGLDMPRPDPEAARREERKKSLVEWMEAAQAFFERKLKGSEGAEARAYLSRRGLSMKECERFSIGYAPNSRRALKDFLLAEGAKSAELLEVGLLIEPEGGGEPYDRFRDRVMFPIHDARGRLVAFGGRALSSDARAKYLNSPETSLFHKGSCLYRFPEARRFASDPGVKARGLIVAEGYMDVIAFARAGMGHAVAPLGTALTEDQLRLLWRAGGEPVVCLDGDSAGVRAAASAAERALPLLEAGRTLRFAFLPEGQDPDDMLRERGAQALREAIAEPRPLIDVLWEREKALEPLTDPDARASFRKRLRALVAKINDADLRNEYTAEFDRRLAAELGAGFAGRRTRGERGWRRDKDPLAGPATASLKAARAAPRASAPARQLLLAAIEWPEIAENEAETLAELPLGPLDSLRDGVLDACSSEDLARAGGLRAVLAERGFSQSLKRLEAERAPMRAAMGGDQAAMDARAEAWRRLAASYMDKLSQEARQAEERARLEGVFEGGNSDELKKVVAAMRRGRVNKGGAR
ncbi:DNA primase [Marinicauda algicola]|uniref:DNA primase n=1 Tax=Marinicauda algicola TaxID=2029849 RepID=A0A4S2GYU9_9PROT|nr:DNA primase [Marinicauda algicola]TGY88355.1 DNA primase [Marinicauda algicola]